MKYLTSLRPRREALTRLTVIPLVLTAALAGCADDRVLQLGAQPDGEGTEATTEATEEITYTAADTATRTVAEAIAQTLARYAAEDSAKAADTTAAAAPRPQYRAGENPDFARQMGWPVNGPKPLPGALLPEKRILCYYGNPNSTRMGALGEFPKDEMLRRLNQEVDNWNKADPAHPVMPCLHMVAVVAQGDAGTSGHYRSIMRDTTVKEVYSWAKSVNGIFIVDIQVGTDDIRNILPRFEWILKNPDVHLAVDPEFYMRDGVVPGRKIGTMHAADINYVTEYMAKLIRDNNLPPKVLVIHRFTRNMVTNTPAIKLRPEVQIVMDMDGWGAPWLKRDSYRDYVVREPVEYTGFKLFYNNDTKAGDPLMTPGDLLKLHPQPLYIQYQ